MHLHSMRLHWLEVTCAVPGPFSAEQQSARVPASTLKHCFVWANHHSAMSSSDYSPEHSSSFPRNSKHGGPEYATSDANIRNFAPVARIMKTALPENAKIAKEAKECMQECVSEFISFITSEGKPILDPYREKQ